MTGLRRRGPASLWPVGLGVLFAVAVVVSPTLTVLATLLAVGAVVFLVQSTRRVWQLVLVLFVLVPVQWLPVPSLVQTLAPPFAGVLVLTLRPFRLVGDLRPVLGLRTVLLLAMGAWLCLCVLISDYRLIGRGWLLSFLPLVLLVAWLGACDPHARRALLDCWSTVAPLLGAYALVETYVLHGNPLMAPLYALADPALVQHWSVYRATTTLGHPVDNGIFFAVSAPLLLARALRLPGRGATAGVLLALGGAVASGSRAALLAAVVGCAVAGLPVALRVRGRRPLLVVALLVVAATVGVAVASTRSASVEATTSAEFRVTEVRIAVTAASQAPVFGVGPGAASFAHGSELTRNGGAGAFESIWLEAVVGAGVPGLLLLVALLVTGAVDGARKQDWGSAGALVAYGVVASAYNVLEGGRASHILLGMLLAMAFCPTREVDLLPRGLLAGPGSAPRPRTVSAPERDRVPVRSPR